MAIVNFNTDKDFLALQKDHNVKKGKIPKNSTIPDSPTRLKVRNEIITSNLYDKIAGDHIFGRKIIPEHYEKGLFNRDFIFYNQYFQDAEKDKLKVRGEKYRSLVKKASDKVYLDKQYKKERLESMQRQRARRPSQQTAGRNIIRFGNRDKNLNSTQQQSMTNTQKTANTSLYCETTENEPYRMRRSNQSFDLNAYKEDNEEETEDNQMDMVLIMKELMVPDQTRKKKTIHHVLGEKKPQLPRFHSRHESTDIPHNSNSANPEFYSAVEKKRAMIVPKGNNGQVNKVTELRHEVDRFQNKLREIRQNVSNELGYDPFSSKQNKYKINSNVNGNTIR